MFSSFWCKKYFLKRKVTKCKLSVQFLFVTISARGFFQEKRLTFTEITFWQFAIAVYKQLWHNIITVVTLWCHDVPQLCHPSSTKKGLKHGVGLGSVRKSQIIRGTGRSWRLIYKGEASIAGSLNHKNHNWRKQTTSTGPICLLQVEREIGLQDGCHW